MMALAESSIQLVPDGTLLLHLTLIIVMVTVLNVTLLRPINKVLEERERRTTGKLSDAQQIFASAKERMRLWEKGLREARNDAYRRLEKERAEALVERQAQVAGLKAELGEWVDKERTELSRQKEQARASLELEARHLGLLIGSQILGKTLDTRS